ncbi:homocysteine S-methyltransferase 3-like isoform X2 [Glossina fuscipes]|uniref:Homocysteine S-methyltransferase 3-like isoform X2 n=1 Tax=Glossina fuscipes TaxID=7396 RepID=A0A9C6DX22_9MUSC|nr:homocysteine S-methyltransferase 3-like isoform X2 [Glossina fuscipes]KAI9577993.1 hypothetical protein GQX74_014137 [Glossina fuscipes]
MNLRWTALLVSKYMCHRTRIEVVLSGGEDGLAVETAPCKMKAEAVTEMFLKDYLDEKFCVSFQCKDELRLAYGENFANAAKTFWELIRNANAVDRLYGVGVNHKLFISF